MKPVILTDEKLTGYFDLPTPPIRNLLIEIYYSSNEKGWSGTRGRACSSPLKKNHNKTHSKT
jgi:hypothetical protein